MTISYIGPDDEHANAWIKHGETTPTQSYRSVWELTRGAVTRLTTEDTDARLEQFYRVYSQLCMAKRGHSTFLLHQTYVRSTDGVVEAGNGPSVTDLALRAPLEPGWGHLAPRLDAEGGATAEFLANAHRLPLRR